MPRRARISVVIAASTSALAFVFSLQGALGQQTPVAPAAAAAAVPSGATPAAGAAPQASKPSPAAVTDPRAVSQSAATADKDGNLNQAFWTALVQEIPKALSAAIAALLAWIVGSRITAAWDMRKKRGEFDILLAKEFYSVVASFKTVAREWDALWQRRNAAGADATAWRAAQVELAKRALEAESNLESILLKLVTEGIGSDDLSTREKERRRRTLSLFRLAYRNLRESVEEGAQPPPGWRDPRLWLFNRLTGEISRIVYERSTQTPWYARPPRQAIDAEDYLGLMANRTTDLRTAAASLEPGVAAFFRQRAADRAEQRKANVERALEPGRIGFVAALPAAVEPGRPAAALPPVPAVEGQATVAVEIVGERRDTTRAAEAANPLFLQYPNLRYYLVLCDEPPRVIVGERGGAINHYDELGAIETGLPWAGRPVRAADLLRWRLGRESNRRLAEIATHPL